MLRYMDPDASVVVTVVPIAIVVVYGNDLGFPNILWYSSFLPALAKDFVVMTYFDDHKLCVSTVLWKMVNYTSLFV